MKTEEAAQHDLEQAVAVVGMSGRFPGAPDLDAYWANLRDGVCSLSEFTEEELLADGTDPSELRHPAFVPVQGYLADADRFEAELFGFNRTEAAALDPQHRVLLETAWSALEDAGYAPLNAPSRTGVYMGGSSTEHALAAETDQALAASLGAMQVRLLTDREFLAPWVSYRLGLDGPSMMVQTACSSSLTAVHVAVQALLLGECDTALAGGVSIGAPRKEGYVYYQGGTSSPDGRCRPFDEKAAGTVPGSGVGVLVLRRLEDALADGDPVRAVIRGTAVTNDGAGKVGFTAPGVDRQTAAITEAWTAAGLEPSAAQYVEAHGTGTELGDRIELAAASAAFTSRPGLASRGDLDARADLDARTDLDARAGLDGGVGIALGSVKSNIGHADAAAGVAALIKTVLMLEHATLAPTVNVTSPMAALRDSPLRLVTETRHWPRRPDLPRLAGVTSVGMGGTNVHAVVQEAPAREPRAKAGGRPTVLPLSARTEHQLALVASRLAARLRESDAPALALADVAHTLRTGRVGMPVRAYVVAAGVEEASGKLMALADGHPDPVRDPSGEAWLRGEEVTWPTLDGEVRRVRLPSYPFAGESYGALTLRGPAAQASTAQASTAQASAAQASAAQAPAAQTPAAQASAAQAPAENAAFLLGGELVDRVTELVIEALDLDGSAGLEKTYLDGGGDSLTSVHLAGRLRDELDIDVPIDLFLEPVTLKEMTLRIVEHKERGEDAGHPAHRVTAARRPTFASVHGEGVTEVHAKDLTLDKFLDAHLLADAPALPRAEREPRTVLLTGANGYLGRFLALEWLRALAPAGGRLIALVRGKDAVAARQRLDAAYDSGDPELVRTYEELAAAHLEVVAGDMAEPRLGLDEAAWDRLADEVDLIVHAGAVVNHLLPYPHLFDANVVGTAEVVRLALTRRMKPITYISSVGVADSCRPALDEDTDVRVGIPALNVDDGYANGYATSKWAGEVLLREAHDLCEVPVTAFRSSMVLAHSRYGGQLNVTDVFSRLLFSVLATGIAPRSFYRADGERAHYDGLPVDFTVAAMVALGGGSGGSTSEAPSGCRTFSLVNPHDDGVSLDAIVDWLARDGHAIERVDDYAEWYQRFEAALRALPQDQRQYAALPILHGYKEPEDPVPGSVIPSGRFRAAVRSGAIAGHGEIPSVTCDLVAKYARDLKNLMTAGRPTDGGLGDRTARLSG
ncbi:MULTISPECIES: thioester reductase domain-containing protein [unclassified Streptomyces]|uniref:thioester reductase domain-containing protein n=1 Tax=unclassified Streptomyces TaxID=2593676 RepID=UPI00136F76E5|nr:MULTISPECIES: thioester reductase domain-containing protein [unclassified Streptomyces]MYY83935.1 NAD-dependent epimerase/dehydratase family protein [Streptomyces sp. SID335]MYZ16179.1 NAD-dependent epimerase/dehydratase family protein [Streptomyces sp. SID337]NDZ84137.1 NAD-dependent epimerase/dehydratase family protein [Streptomyces sp. SID10115]NEB44654.1 NAD-dependent epimerase/dehydratase family protein [Streptomyces sp. SID339]